jgi:hypothetical protein
MDNAQFRLMGRNDGGILRDVNPAYELQNTGHGVVSTAEFHGYCAVPCQVERERHERESIAAFLPQLGYNSSTAGTIHPYNYNEELP